MSIRTRVLVLSEGQILLIPANGAADLVWRLPGGGLEPHESLSECAEREILEETGIRVRAGKIAFLREWVVPAGGSDRYGLEVFLYAHPDRPVPEPLPEGADGPLARWFPVGEVASLPLWPKEVKDLCSLLAEGEGAPEGVLSFVSELESPWARSARNPFRP